MAKKGFSIRILVGFLFLFAGAIIFLDQLNLLSFFDLEPFRMPFTYIISIGSALAGFILIFKRFLITRETEGAFRKGL
ncbi:MAG TPA: hypothetical protein VJB08_03525 [Candidatus Nanoarchaeia archaeon]|nr:hypothetical protein [Candidatus Nanoarchaeia archaeon]